MKNLTRILSGLFLIFATTFTARSQSAFKVSNVGVGNVNPSEKLDVVGNVKFSQSLMPNNLSGTVGNILLSGGAGASPTWLVNGTTGYFLFENAGVPTWTDPSNLAWNFTGGNVTSATYGTNFLGTINNVALEFIGTSQALGPAGLLDPTNQNVYFGGGLTSPSSDWVGNIRTTIINGSKNNVALGNGAMGGAVGTGNGTSNNVFVGYVSGFQYSAVSSNNGSTVIGDGAFRFTTTGVPNTGFGINALAGNGAGGTNNLAMGSNAGAGHTTGVKDVGLGVSALKGTTTANNNTGVGYQALFTTSSGTGNNTALGYEAANNATTAHNNTAIGYTSGFTNTTLYGNTSVGANALNGTNSTGGGVTAVGTGAMKAGEATASNAPGVAIGDSAMFANTGTNIVVIGTNASVALAGSNCQVVAVGYDANEKDPSIGAAFQGMVFGWKALGNATSVGSNNAPHPIGANAMGNTAGISGAGDIGIGVCALFNVTSGASNVAIGSANNITNANNNATLGKLTTGSSNVAIGFNSSSFTNGGSNVAIGANTSVGGNSTTVGTGGSNVAAGTSSIAGSVTTAAVGSSDNTALGYSSSAGNIAVLTDFSTAIGSYANAAPTTGTTAATTATALGDSAFATANNSTAIGAKALANTANTLILGSINGINAATSNVNVGIGTSAPAQALEIGGTGNTIRIDGIIATKTFSTAPTASTDEILFAKSTGDVEALPNSVTNGATLVLNASGIPAWGSPPSTVTATAPLSNTGSPSAPNILLSGTSGGVLYGTGVGTGSAFTTVGSSGDILEEGSGGTPDWVTASSPGTNDNWGTQIVVTDSSNSAAVQNTLTGDGATHPLRLAKQGATNGKVLAWNGSTWKPSAANASLTGLTNIAPAAGSVLTVANGTNQVIGGSNVTIDIQGTSGGLLSGNGAGTSATFTAGGSNGQVFTSNGASTPSWQALSVPVLWGVSGNAGTTPGVNFIGTTDDQSFMFKLASAYAGIIDPQTVAATTKGNTYMGSGRSNNSVNGAGNTDIGSYNTAFGQGDMGMMTGGSDNIAFGALTLPDLGTGSDNIAFDWLSLRYLSNGNGNIGIGAGALYGISNTSSYNTAIGFQTAGSSTGACGGNFSCGTNFLGNFNTALGYSVGFGAASAGNEPSNTLMGTNSGYTTVGGKNTTIGDSTLYTNTSGTKNTAVGYASNVSSGALTNATAIGARALAAQNNTIVLGAINGVGQGVANTNVGIGTNTPAADAGIAFKTVHIESQVGSTAPTFTLNPLNGGVGGFIPGQVSTDVAGGVTFTMPSGSGFGPSEITVNFATAYAHVPTVVLAPANTSAAAAMTASNYTVYVTSTTAGFTVNFNGSIVGTSNQAFNFNYFVIETQ